MKYWRAFILFIILLEPRQRLIVFISLFVFDTALFYVLFRSLEFVLWQIPSLLISATSVTSAMRAASILVLKH